MKKIIIILLLITITICKNHHSKIIYNKCGTQPPTINLIVEEYKINHWLEENSSNQNRDNLDIPIAFHIIYANNSSNGGYIEESSIYEQINVLNNVFDFANISFTIHSINYIQNSDWYYNDDEYSYKEELSITPGQILNIYTTTAGGYLGYAYLPNQWAENSYMHGVVLNPYTFPDGDWPYNEGDTAVHEIGHYLGLLHTFNGGCSGNGDYVSDTPDQDDGDNIYDCIESLDTCTSSGNDPIHNFMNYTDDDCLTEFSNGQVSRMDYMINEFKSNLGCSLDYDCAGTCGGNLELDCCGMCGGDNSTCNNCCGLPFNDDCTDDCYTDNYGICCIITDTDCAGLCYENTEIDECGICGGFGIPAGYCDCNGNLDLGCGCGAAGPSGCNEACGSILEFDECNICGGDGTSCQNSGDLNGDELINITDIVILVDWILNNNLDSSGDLNQDGSINVTDIVLLIDLILNPQ